MRVLVLGDTGFIGRAVARRAAELGYFVAGVSRSEPDASDACAEHHIVTRADHKHIADIVRTRHISTVIDCAAFTLAATAPLIQALDGIVMRYILLSSGDVYRTYDVINRRDLRAPLDPWLDEDSPLRSSRFPYRGEHPRPAADSQRWMDDYDKIPIEEAVRNLRATAWTILRLPMVYGPGDRMNRFAWATAPIHAGATSIVIPRPWAAWRTTYGDVDNVAAGIVLAATHPAAARAIFNLGEAEPAPHAEWAGRFAAALGWKGSIEISDDPDLPLARLTNRMNLTVPLLLRTARVRHSLGYSELVSLDESVRRTAALAPTPRRT